GNREDGILTAYEISHLNLSDTRLAVLSACQTGLGDIKGSEGVFGLQRAFKMAGVDYLLVSLWQVPDQETADFMEAFYAAWTGGNTVHSAFAKAQKQMRIKYKEVYRWGAWVLVE
ncbi:MAG: CHAT domain-containing protein, partial [Bacteroidota bacterium]